MPTKDLIRTQVKKELEALSNEAYTRASQQITEHLIRSPYWRAADVIALTISRGKEVDTFPLIRQAWEQGKRVTVPCADFIEKKMIFYQINDFTNLEERAFGLKEPDPKKNLLVPVKELDLIIVPGLAFDQEGARLGFGGGFYDRFLPKVSAKTIALAFSCQLVSAVPTEEHDQKVDHIISPEGFYR